MWVVRSDFYSRKLDIVRSCGLYRIPVARSTGSFVRGLGEKFMRCSHTQVSGTGGGQRSILPY